MSRSGGSRSWGAGVALLLAIALTSLYVWLGYWARHRQLGGESVPISVEPDEHLVFDIWAGEDVDLLNPEESTFSDVRLRVTGGRLSRTTTRRLARNRTVGSPPENETISLATSAFVSGDVPGCESDEACRPQLAIQPLPPGDSASSRIRLRASRVRGEECAGGDPEERDVLCLRPESGMLRVSVHVLAPVSDPERADSCLDTRAATCERVVRVGKKSYHVPAPLNFGVDVESGGELALSFDRKRGAKSAFEPLELGKVHAVEVWRSGREPAIIAMGFDGKDSLRVEDLVFEPSGRELGLHLSGDGEIEVAKVGDLPGGSGPYDRFEKWLRYRNPLFYFLMAGLLGYLAKQIGTYLIEKPAAFARRKIGRKRDPGGAGATGQRYKAPSLPPRRPR